MSDIILELAREEAADAAVIDELAHEVSASRFLTMGLNIEEQQYITLLVSVCYVNHLNCRRVLTWQVSQKRITAIQATKLAGKRHALRCRINNWQDIQAVYMPGVHRICFAPDATSSNAPPDPTMLRPDHPETFRLSLPSSLSPSLWASACASGLVAKEANLRLDQADDALNELRRQLRISATILNFKKLNVGGTSQSRATRAGTLLHRFRDKTNRAAQCYSAAFAALSKLDCDGECGDWKLCLCELNHANDLRLPGRAGDDEEESKHYCSTHNSQGKHILSWIWGVKLNGVCPTEVASDDEVNNSTLSCYNEDKLSINANEFNSSYAS